MERADGVRDESRQGRARMGVDGWSYRRVLSRGLPAVFAAVFAVTAGGTAAADPAPNAAPIPAVVAGQGDSVTTTTPVDYNCFVTFQGGSTVVQFSLAYTATAPEQVGALERFSVTIDPPAITPNPAINIRVQDVRVVFRLPDTAWLIRTQLTGGSGLGPGGAEVEREPGVVILKAHGPFPAAQEFDLPTLRLLMIARPRGGVAEVAQGGVTLADPAFSWIRTDPDGSGLRPFSCFAAAPVPLTATTIHPR